MEIVIKFEPGQPPGVSFPESLAEHKEVLYHLLLDAFLIIQSYKSSPIVPGNLINFPIKGGKIS